MKNLNKGVSWSSNPINDGGTCVGSDLSWGMTNF